MIIGLDIGKQIVRACIFDGSFGRYKFTNNIQKAIAPASEEEDPQEKQLDAIQSLLLGMDTKTVVTSFSTSTLSVRRISLPFTDMVKIEQVLPSFIEEKIPFDIDEVQIQHRILDIKDNSSDILVILTPLVKISEHLDHLDTLNITPKHIVIDADILSSLTTTGVECILHFYTDSVTCGVYKDNKTIALRNIPHNLDAMDEVHTLPTQLIEAIRNTLIRVEDQNSVDIERIHLSGYYVEAPSISTQLTSEFAVETNPIALPNGLSPEWTLSYCLAQKGAGESHGREFDLRHGDFAYKGNLQLIGTIIQIGATLSLLALLGCTGWYWMQTSKISTQLDDIQSKIETQIHTTMPDVSPSVLAKPAMVISILQEEIQTSNEKLEKLGSIVASEPPVLTLVKELSDGMPAHTTARIDVSELIISKNTINVKAETDGFQTATEIEQSLKQRPRFKQAQKADEKSIKNGINFSIVIPLQIEETEEEG